MKKIKLIYGSVITLSFILSNSASATVFDFNYNNLGVTAGETYNSVSMTAESISVDVNAFTVINDGNGNINSLTEINVSGLGIYVNSSATNGSLGVRSSSSDGRELDGGTSSSDPDEGMLFSFSEIVSLNYVDFDNFTSSRNDDFNLTVDGKAIVWDFSGNDSSDFVTQVPGQHSEYNFTDISGKNFFFWADGRSDSFLIDKLSVTSSIPEPMTLFLLGVGLLGFTLVRSKNGND